MARATAQRRAQRTAQPSLDTVQRGAFADSSPSGDRDAVADLLHISAGKTVGLVGRAGLGLTRLGMTMLAPIAAAAPVAVIDVRGWVCPAAAWEAGIPASSLIVVRCPDLVHWGKVTAVLVEGMAAVYAEVPRGVKESVIRALAARARARGSVLVLRPLSGDVPRGVTHARWEALGVRWEGTEAGHGRLTRRRLRMRVSGRAVQGIPREIELEDDGTNAVRLVSGLAAAPHGVAAG